MHCLPANHLFQRFSPGALAAAELSFGSPRPFQPRSALLCVPQAGADKARVRLSPRRFAGPPLTVAALQPFAFATHAALFTGLSKEKVSLRVNAVLFMERTVPAVKVLW